MADKMSISTLLDIIEDEGLDYTLRHYCSPEHVDGLSPELREKWTQFARLGEELEKELTRD